MAWSKAKTAISTAAIVLLFAAGAGTVIVKTHSLMQTHTPRFQPRLARAGQALRISADGKVSVINLPTNLAPVRRAYGHNAGSAMAFNMKASHDTILQQLDQKHALILSDTPDLVRAQLTNTKTAPAEWDFKFVDEKLATITVVRADHGSNVITFGPGR